MQKHWLGKQGAIRISQSSSRIETPEEGEGSNKDFIRNIDRNIKENVSLIRNQTNSLEMKDNSCQSFCCQCLCLVGEFGGEGYFPK